MKEASDIEKILRKLEFDIVAAADQAHMECKTALRDMISRGDAAHKARNLAKWENARLLTLIRPILEDCLRMAELVEQAIDGKARVVIPGNTWTDRAERALTQHAETVKKIIRGKIMAHKDTENILWFGQAVEAHDHPKASDTEAKQLIGLIMSYFRHGRGSGESYFENWTELEQQVDQWLQKKILEGE